MHSFGPLLDKFPKVVFNSGPSSNCKEFQVINDLGWCWPCARSTMLQIHAAISGVFFPNAAVDDTLIRNSCSHGSYTTASAWKTIRVKCQHVNWYSAFGSAVYSKHCFISWLLVLNRLASQTWDWQVAFYVFN